MKVKVGNKIYNTDTEPIMLIFDNEQERDIHSSHIYNMRDGAIKYLIYKNDYMTDKEATEYIKNNDTNLEKRTITNIVVECKGGTDSRDFKIYARTNDNEDIQMRYCQIMKLNITAVDMLPTVDLQFVNPIININLKEVVKG